MAGQHWDLIVTLDDATSEHYSMFFVEEEGTASSFQAMAQVIETHGLPSSLYTDRGSHYWTTPEAGGKSLPPRKRGSTACTAPSSGAPCTRWALR